MWRTIGIISLSYYIDELYCIIRHVIKMYHPRKLASSWLLPVPILMTIIGTQLHGLSQIFPSSMATFKFKSQIQMSCQDYYKVISSFWENDVLIEFCHYFIIWKTVLNIKQNKGQDDAGQDFDFPALVVDFWGITATRLILRSLKVFLLLFFYLHLIQMSLLLHNILYQLIPLTFHVL